MADTKFVLMSFSDVKCGGEIMVRANSTNTVHLTKIPVSRVNNAGQHDNYNVGGAVKSPMKFNAMNRGALGFMNFYFILENTTVAYILGS